MTKIKFIGLAFIICWAVCFSGWADDSQAKNGRFQKTVLDSGMPLIFQQDTSSRITVLQFSIAGGQFAEPMDKSGLSYLTTRLTLVLPDRTKTQTIMDNATQLLMTSKEDYSLVTIACLSENLEESWEVAGEIMLNPLISGIRIKNNKDQMERQINMLQDDSENIAHQTAVENLFPGTRYARAIYGNEKSIKSIKKKDIKEFFQNYFRPGNVTAVVCSDLKKETILGLLRKNFSDFPSGPPPSRPEYTAPEIRTRTQDIERATQQTLVGMAYRLPSLNSGNYICAHLLENVLGKGIGSKLWPLREEEKLAYHVNARSVYFREGGVLEVYLETDSEKKEDAEKELAAVMDTVFAKGIEKQEWESVLNFGRAAYLRANETKQQRVQTISFFEITGLDYTFFTEILNQMESYPLNKFNAFLKKVLNPENRTAFTIGPKSSE